MRVTSLRLMELGPAGRSQAATGLVGVMAVLSLVVLALLFRHFDFLPVAAVLILCLAATLFLIRPNAATTVTLFLLYVNFPAILTKRWDVPPVAAGAFILLLCFPLLYLLFVRGERLRADRTFGLMLVFLAVLLVSALGAVDKDVAIAQVVQYLLEGLFLYWLIVNVVRTRLVLQRVIWTLLVAGGLVSALSLYQDVTGSYQQEFGGLAYRNYVADNPELVEEGEAPRRPGKSHRAQGPLDEPNRFAQTLIVLLPLSVLSYRGGRTRRERLSAAVAGLLILAGIGITLSRSSALNVVMIALCMSALRWIRPAHLAACLVALLIGMSILSPRFLPRMLSVVDVRYLMTRDVDTRDQADGAIRGRTTSMLTAFNVFRDHPMLGVGPAQFRFYYAEYSANPDIRFRRYQQGVSRRAHNLYLEMAAETGVVGVGVFVGMVLLLMHALWQARRRLLPYDPGLSDVATAFLLSLLAYLGTSMFLHLSYQRYFWLLLALASAALHVVNSEALPSQERQLSGQDVDPVLTTRFHGAAHA